MSAASVRRRAGRLSSGGIWPKRCAGPTILSWRGCWIARAASTKTNMNAGSTRLPSRSDTVFFAIEEDGTAHRQCVAGRASTGAIAKPKCASSLAPTAVNRGCGSRAIELIADHAFSAMGLNRVYAFVLAFNPRGRRAFEKAQVRPRRHAARRSLRRRRIRGHVRARPLESHHYRVNLLFDSAPWTSPSISPAVADAMRIGCGVLMLVTLIRLVPDARRYFLSERWGGYGERGWRVDLIQNPVVMPVLLIAWIGACIALAAGRYPTIAAADQSRDVATTSSSRCDGAACCAVWALQASSRRGSRLRCS